MDDGIDLLPIIRDQYEFRVSGVKGGIGKLRKAKQIMVETGRGRVKEPPVLNQPATAPAGVSL
jgi:hypothetical protein